MASTKVAPTLAEWRGPAVVAVPALLPAASASERRFSSPAATQNARPELGRALRWSTAITALRVRREQSTGTLRGVGAWGSGAFENDDAADWANEFEDQDATAGLAIIRSAIAAVEESEYVEAPEGSSMVAAAQVIAALVSPASTTTTYGAAALDWAARSGARPDVELVSAARRALQRVIAADSELAELWEEAGGEDWRAEIDRIIALLG